MTGQTSELVMDGVLCRVCGDLVDQYGSAGHPVICTGCEEEE